VQGSRWTLRRAHKMPAHNSENNYDSRCKCQNVTAHSYRPHDTGSERKLAAERKRGSALQHRLSLPERADIPPLFESTD
jgi:hypothetical protein